MNIYESLRNSGEDVKHMHRDALEREVLSLRQEIIRLNTPQTPAPAGEPQNSDDPERNGIWENCPECEPQPQTPEETKL